MHALTYGSVCSGAGTCALAFIPLGAKAVWFCEIEKAPSAVIAHHWPGVPNLGDMTTLPERIRSGEVPAPDIFMGGTPCQAFSIAGKRASLEDRRGNLTLIFVEIADAIDDVRRTRGQPPVVILWENVPGVLSVKDNAFGCFLGGLAGSGAAIDPGDRRWSYAGLVSGPTRSAGWRILDAQYFGVPQRRRRVVVVAGAGAFRPSEVLFESEGVRRDSAPSRKAMEVAARTITGGARKGGGYSVYDIPITIQAGACRENPNSGPAGIGVRTDGLAYTLEARAEVQLVFGGNTGGAIDVAPSLTAKGSRLDFETEALCVTGDITHALKAEGADGSEDGATVAVAGSVRRLTPRECERLQGWPDDHTLVPYRDKLMQDGPRYKIIGNGWALPVFAWVGKRIVREMSRSTCKPTTTERALLEKALEYVTMRLGQLNQKEPRA